MEKPGFEELIKRLEKIVGRLESGELPLEDSLTLFEEGINIFKLCTKRLEEAQARVQRLVKDLKGEFHLTPLEGEDEL
jgi:exodeoxyribonuclease VII small subunit